MLGARTSRPHTERSTLSRSTLCRKKYSPFALSADRKIGTEPLAVASECLTPSLELMLIVNPLATAGGSVTQLL